MSRLRFGIFMAPFHPAGENPTLALQRDLALVEHLDRLGYDEAWIGEHHSAGSEIIASPEIFIAAAAERTRHIKLGTGVTSLAYHNPLWVTERMVLLDHLTRGRAMLGVGPGSLPTDSAMLGLNPTDTRELLDVNFDVVMRLLRGDEPVIGRDADPQARRRAAAPAPVLRAAHGRRGRRRRLAHRPAPGRALRRRAAVGRRHADRGGLRRAGPPLERDGGARRDLRHRRSTARKWRLVGLMHIAETREQAYRDVEYGIEQWFRYFQKVAAFPQMAVEGGDVREMIDFVNTSGIGAVGTVEDAAAQVEKLVDQSGGFGAMLLLAHEWANPVATHRSYELIAQHVMPLFQGQAQSTLDAKARATETRPGMAEQQNQAVAHMTEKYQQELAAGRS